MTTRQRSTSSSTDPPVRREVVLGVDTHGEVHVAAVISPLGKILGTESFPATAAGYRQLLVWARKRGTVRRAGVEGTGNFGAGLSRYLLAQQAQVYEVNRPDRLARRLLGKSDPLDAQAAARAVLSGRAPARAKSGDGPVRSPRMFKLAKESAVKARTRRSTSSRPSWSSPSPPCGNGRRASATESCSAPARTSTHGTARARRRGGPGHPHDVAHTRRAHRTAHRTDR
ncbi:transposase [Streptomyces iakyrus]